MRCIEKTKLLLLVILLSLASCNSTTDPDLSFSVKGKITDASNNAPISAAKITVDTLSTESDPNGNYKIDGISTGTQILTAIKDGYVNYQAEVNIGTDILTHDFSMVSVSGRDIDLNLVAYLPFDGDVLDESGNLNHGEISGGVTFVQGAIGSGIYLDGDRGFVRIANPTQVFSDSYTITLYASPELGGFLVSKYNYASSKADGMGLFLTNSAGSGNPHSGTELKAVTYFDQDWYEHISNFPAYLLTPNEMTHVAVSYSFGTTRIYIDGKLAAEEAIEHLSSLDNTYDIYIGYSTGSMNNNNPKSFKGIVDEVRIYNVALTEAEIADISGQ